MVSNQNRRCWIDKSENKLWTNQNQEWSIISADLTACCRWCGTSRCSCRFFSWSHIFFRVALPPLPPFFETRRVSWQTSYRLCNDSEQGPEAHGDSWRKKVVLSDFELPNILYISCNTIMANTLIMVNVTLFCVMTCRLGDIKFKPNSFDESQIVHGPSHIP